MAFTYDWTATPEHAEIRLRIGDSIYGVGARPRGLNFSDEEITKVLTICDSNVDFAIAMLLEVLSNEWAKMSNITAGPIKQSYSDVSKQFARQVEDTRIRLGIDSKAFSIAMKRMDAYRSAAESVDA